MRGNALITRAKDGVSTIEPIDCSAAAARIAFVAGRDSIAKLAAPGALPQVAADGRHIAQLLGGAQLQGL